MLNIGGGELLIILLVALIFLGPTRLPQVARQLGQTMASLRSLATGFQAELEAASRPDNYDGPMYLGTDSAAGAEVEAAAHGDSDDGGDDPDHDPGPTDPQEIGRAARQVDVADADPLADEKSPGGPTDLTVSGDEEE